MKRLLSVLLILCLLPIFALADFDLSALSFAELKALQTQLNTELVNRPEWKEVTVPKGYYVIGEDIPEGTYSITLKDKKGSCYIGVWGYAVKDYKTNGGLIYNLLLMSDDNTIGRIVLKAGWTIEFSNSVIMQPPKGLDF